MKAIFSLLLLAWISVSVADAQVTDSPPPPSEGSQTVLQGSDVGDPFGQRLVEFERGLIRYFDALYAARLNAMEMERNSFDNLLLAAKWFGGVASLLLVFLAFVAGRSLRELREAAVETAKFQARSLFDAEMAKAASETGSLQNLFENAKKIEADLIRLRDELAGFSSLRDVAQTATSFDPQVQYQSLDKEIDARHDATIRLAMGDESVSVSETIRDPEFRQKAAVIFKNFIETARNGLAGKNLTVDAVTLFNAAKNASKADMDFVALEFMQIASEISRGSKPEIEASLVRQKLTMSRYEDGPEGHPSVWADIRMAISKARAFDLHLVISEAFNIGLQLADPPRMSSEIQSSLPEDLKNLSYSDIIRCRLLLIGGTGPNEWNDARKLFCSALSKLRTEPSSARWFKHTSQDIAKVVAEQPGIVEACDEITLSDVFGGMSDIRSFVRKFGGEAAQIFQQCGLLERFLPDGEQRAEFDKFHHLLSMIERTTQDQGEKE